MKKLISLILIILVFQYSSLAQEKKYYGICEYKISGGNAYISKPMLINKDWIRSGAVQTGDAKFTALESNLKKEFTKDLESKYGITVNDSYPNEYDALIYGDYPNVVPDCAQCMWTYDQATKIMKEQMNFLSLRNYTVVIADFSGNLKAKDETAKVQEVTAYAYYFVNKTLNGKDIYIFTSPKPFKYTKGSAYVFNPVEFEKMAEQTIQTKLKIFDPSFDGLYENQISNGGNTSFKNLQNTKEEIKEKMAKLYQSQQKEQYRASAVEIIQIDIATGKLLSEYTLPASQLNNNKSGAGNAN
ncbi:MAG TPA: hypothetical protein VIJ75_07995 [Hanamia sp.]